MSFCTPGDWEVGLSLKAVPGELGEVLTAAGPLSAFPQGGLGFKLCLKHGWGLGFRKPAGASAGECRALLGSKNTL